MLAVCLPMCSTVDTMARGDKGDNTINSQGQGFTSYSPHPTVFKGLCPTTVGRTAPTAPLSADRTHWSTGGTLNMGKKDWLAKSWSLPLPVIYPSPPLATGSTVEHMERHTVSIRVLRRAPSAGAVNGYQSTQRVSTQQEPAMGPCSNSIATLTLTH